MKRISESELIVPALRLMAARADGFISTSDLIAALSEQFKPTGRDAEIALHRGDSYFSQKVRNLVCHRYEATGMQANGIAEYDARKRGWRITSDGRAFLVLAHIKGDAP